MTDVPSPGIQTQGQGAVSGPQLNSYVQAVNNVAQLRGLVGQGQMLVLMEGFNTQGDGGQGLFGWDTTSASPDDGGVTVVDPTSSGPTGRWLRIPLGGGLGAVNSNLSFEFLGGPPTSSQIIALCPLPIAITLQPNLSGSVGYAATLPTATFTFLVNQIRAGVTTQVGTVVISTAGAFTFTSLTGLAVPFNAGDTLECVAPSMTDATLADFAWTFYALVT